MRRPLLVGYLLLLAASTAVRWQLGREHELNDDPLRGGPAEAPPILLLPDASSPPEALAPIADRLIVSFQVLIRDADRRGGASASFDAQADSVATLLDCVHWPSAHVVAFGTSGGTAIELIARHPDRVRTLTLVSAMGVEEFDLLGDHRLNLVLRRGELALLWSIRNAVPHFGLLDQGRMESRDAEVLVRSDRRSFREILRRWSGPTLILHAANDLAVPAATAREHARLLPQSTLKLIDGDQLSIDEVVVPIRLAIKSAERGAAITRATASPVRVAAAALPFDADGLASAQGVSLWVVLGLLALTTLLSEDLACVAAGVLAARGSIPLVPAILACYIGIVAGDQLLYLLGRSVGRAILTLPPFRWWVTSAALDRAHAWFTREGMRVVLTSRLLPGTRFPVYVTAGILRGGFVRFALWLMVVGAIWTPLLVGGSYVAARRGRNLVEALPGESWPWALGGILLLVLILRVIPPLVGRFAGRGSAEPPVTP